MCLHRPRFRLDSTSTAIRACCCGLPDQVLDQSQWAQSEVLHTLTVYGRPFDAVRAMQRIYEQDLPIRVSPSSCLCR